MDQKSSTNDNQLSELTQERSTKSNAIQIPSISLPKGGGALKGIDEKFEVNAANGSASFSIPLPISPGRNGFSPSLSLSYNSGAGNGPYGLGWSVGYPSIQRKTDKKLPRYRDGFDEDTFMFSGAEDLVPYLKEANGDWKEKEYPNNGTDGYTIKRYRPRIEGSFARIEKIHHESHGMYWKVTTGDNVATIFGRNIEARIADPENPAHIFEWLPEFSYDDKGNWIKYEYKEENLDNVPNTLNEKNRLNGLAPITNQYLKRIRYGNRKAYYAETDKPYDPQSPIDEEHFFELVMDYGEHTDTRNPQTEIAKWEYREDAFSSFRSGFEIRTNRLCKRILMFHHFEEEQQLHGYKENGDKITSAFGEHYLVSSLELNHEKSSVNNSNQTEVTYLKSIAQTGYIRKPGGEYSKKSLPPMKFTYEKLNWSKTIKTVNKEAIINAPAGLTNNYQWVDLYGEGISGILTEQGEGWFYKSNLGNVDEDGNVAFSVAQQVISKPSFMGLSNGILSLQNLAANGEKQLVVNSPGIQGYFELTHNNNWKPFKEFEQLANINFQDPNTRMFDLNGDGQPELVLTEDNVFVWHASDGKRGHLPAEVTSKTFDEEKGPAIVFADTQQTIFLADMSGDGLTDIARIRNGEICYWANKGYGNFSAKINMGNAPLFDHPDLFNPQYLHLADVSGTGATDIIYLGKSKFKSYINLSGNAWSDAHEINPFPQIDSNSQLSVVDLLGTGTSSIVWSSDLPAHANAPMHYIDLMDSRKPHVMTKHVNNMGMETTLEYKSSTHYYLKDKLAGKPWVTRLPFPVQVISKQIVEEKITDVRFTTEYKYHHGYFDHPEREFRGFGMVEQIDTEVYEEWEKNNAGNQLEKSETHYQKPILTKTWFHTGAFFDKERILNQFKEEYWFNEYNRLFATEPLTVTEPELIDARLQLATTIQDLDLLEKLSTDEWREALRACKGMMLRQEVFALDAPENSTNEELKLQAKPYTVATHNCNIQLVQPRDKNAFGVFIVTESEAISISYERDETDYRILHNLNTKIDDLGNILESAAVVYGRNQTKADTDFQNLTATITDFSQDVLDNDAAQKTQLLNAFTDNIRATKEEQTKTHIIYTQNSFSKYQVGATDFDDIDMPNAYRLRLPYEAKTYEITGLDPNDVLFKLEEVTSAFNFSSEVDYHLEPTNGIQRRLIEHVKTKYLDDDLDALEFGFFDTLGLPFESYQLGYTPNLVRDIYSKDNIALEVDNEVVNDFIETKGKYSRIDSNLWIRSGFSHFKEGVENIDAVKNRFYSPIAFQDPFGIITAVIYDTETITGGIRDNNGYYLFIRETEDVLHNKSQVDIFNYRTLSPSRMIDINANPSSVLVDELGLVKALVAEGNGIYTDASRTTVTINPGEAADDLSGLTEYEGNTDNADITDLFGASTFNNTDTTQLRLAGNNLLQHASARFIYDFERYRNTGIQPNVVASITREEHFAVNPQSKIQFGFEYSDGAGNVAMVKAQAEPGLAKFMENGLIHEKDTAPELRWIGNGRIVLNNKGNPVKQYEPYFSTNFGHEDAPELVEIGVTPILYYDSIGRLIKTILPDGTLTRVEFDSWKQSSFDPNDTVLDEECFWFKRRMDDSRPDFINDPKEKRAAEKVREHANTPSSVYLDSLGRPVLSIEHNGKDQQMPNKKDRLYTTFIKLDIEGNTRAVIDARGNTVMAYKYDMLGHQVYQNSMDAGQRWIFNNLLGNPLYSWDERNHIFEEFYDDLQRPSHSKVMGGDAEDNTDLDHIYNRVFYGDPEPDTELKNIRGQVIKLYDTGGLIETPAYDFKGQPKSTTRRLFKKYKKAANWIDANLNDDLEHEEFTFITKTDALGRITEQTAPDGSVITPSYNEAGVLTSESVKHLDPNITTTYIKDIHYNEKGQRSKIIYGNGVSTNFHYDKETFRLKRLVSKRKNQGQDPLQDLLQDLHYTYDPVGNITHIEDKVNPVVFFKNNAVTAASTYTYDALYRLIKATGRENKTTVNFGNTDNTNDDAFKLELNPNNPMNVQNYTQSYQYDAVGNFNKMKHEAKDNNWIRNYKYQTSNNRLIDTTVGQNTYTYPHHTQHGFITKMPHLQDMGWNFKEELVKTSKQQVNPVNGTAETTYYQYDGSGQRIRKITEKQAAAGNLPIKKEERIYISGYEVYKKHSDTNSGLERSTLSLLDETHRFVMIETRNDGNFDTEKHLVRYQLHNHLGSASIELDGSPEAKVICYEEYHPYGTTAYQAKNTAIKSAAKRYRYTGMERDEESGLSYHSARYYLPWLGRWLSSDPIGIRDGVNMYEYAKDSPLIFVDLSGTQAQKQQWRKTKDGIWTTDEPFIIVADGLDKKRSSNSSKDNNENDSGIQKSFTSLFSNLASAANKRASDVILKATAEIDQINNQVRLNSATPVLKPYPKINFFKKILGHKWLSRASNLYTTYTAVDEYIQGNYVQGTWNLAHLTPQVTLLHLSYDAGYLSGRVIDVGLGLLNPLKFDSAFGVDLSSGYSSSDDDYAPSDYLAWGIEELQLFIIPGAWLAAEDVEWKPIRPIEVGFLSETTTCYPGGEDCVITYFGRNPETGEIEETHTEKLWNYPE